jgi:hypothetical protein
MAAVAIRGPEQGVPQSRGEWYMDKGERDPGRNRVIAAADDGLDRTPPPIASSSPGSRFWQMFKWSHGGIGLRLLAAMLPK